MQAGLYRVESQEEKETGEWVEGQEQSGEMHVHTHNWLWASLSLSLSVQEWMLRLQRR